MMELFYKWVKNVSYYMILVTVVMGLVSDGKYEKYVQFLTGLILVVLLLSPVIQLLKILQ